MEALFRTVEETPEPKEAEVSGSIPQWLRGTLYRNGPGRFEFGDTKFQHWFDGMALLHRFCIKDGKVTYNSKFLRSDTYKKNLAANRIVVSEFGTFRHPDPCKNIFQRFFSHFSFGEPTDNSLVNVFPFGDSLYVATEFPMLRKVDPETLDSPAKIDLRDYVAVYTATAHPHFDQEGVIYNMGLSNKGYALVKIVPPNKGEDKFAETAEVMTTIAPQWKTCPSYFHSFAFTENYIVLVEMPLVINLLSLLTSHLRGVPVSQCMQWYPDKKCKIHVIDRRTGEKVNPEVNYTTPPLCSFHHVNAYEDNGEVVVDLCFFGSDIYDLPLEKIQGPNGSEFLNNITPNYLGRIHVPLKMEGGASGGKEVECTVDKISSHGIELPQINYKMYNGKKYRYVYGNSWQKAFLDCIVKIDVETGEALVWLEEGHYPSEPVFVPHPEAESEDHGVILSVVLTTGEDRYAYLLVLDAKDFHEVARATVQVRLTRGFHGCFISS